MKREQVRISVLGSTFTIQSDENPEYLARIIRYLEDKVEMLKGSTKAADPLKIAILAGILIVDELFKERAGRSDSYSAQDAQEAERITRKLIEKIDRTLQNL